MKCFSYWTTVLLGFDTPRSCAEPRPPKDSIGSPQVVVLSLESSVPQPESSQITSDHLSFLLPVLQCDDQLMIWQQYYSFASTSRTLTGRVRSVRRHVLTTGLLGRDTGVIVRAVSEIFQESCAFVFRGQASIPLGLLDPWQWKYCSPAELQEPLTYSVTSHAN
jgi:hypothetical protein